MSGSFGGVLWDMDGTLVDTEPYWIEREFEIVAEHGNGQWSDEHAHALIGFDLRDSGRYMAEHGDIDLPIDDIVNLLLDGVVARVRQRVPWRPGARELLAELRAARVPTALVTMSWRRFADAVLQLLPPGSFSTIVTGDEVRYGKPHPEPYTIAADRLALTPADCIAIEDSPTGVRSAVAAGCVVVGVPHVIEIPDHLGHHRLPSLEGVDMTVLHDIFRSRD